MTLQEPRKKAARKGTKYLWCVMVPAGEFVGDPHAVRFLKPHPTDGHKQPASSGFRSGDEPPTTSRSLPTSTSDSPDCRRESSNDTLSA